MKEVQINGKGYYAEEPAADKRYSNEDAIVWDDGPDPNYVHAKLAAALLIDGIPTYVTSHKITFGCAALLSTEHERPKKASRRCTNRELILWVEEGNGYVVEYDYISKAAFVRQDSLDRDVPNGIFVIKQLDDEPMEPTAENMGLKE